MNFGPLSVPFPPHHLFKWLSKWAFKNRLQALPFVDIEISKYIKDFIEVLDPLWPKASHQKSFRTSQSDRITQSETNFLEKYIHFEIKFPKHCEKLLCNQFGVNWWHILWVINYDVWMPWPYRKEHWLLNCRPLV